MDTNNRAAPLRSNPLAVNSPSLGTAFRARTIATIPMGTLMKNTRFQDISSDSTPPMAGPMAPPTAIPSTPMDMAKAAMDLGRNLTQSMKAETASMAAPTPCTALKASSSGSVVESPQSRELTVKIAMPPTNTLLMAPPSATLPKMRISPAIIRK